MMRFIRCAVLALMLTPAPVAAQDFDTGMDAWKAGDYETARGEWAPLAEQGDASAQLNLGLMYYNGEGVPQDHAEAVRWYQLAAEQGDADAQFFLGLMYATELGAVQDYGLAHMWLNIAAATGHEKARKYRDMFADQMMTAGAIAEAQQRARACLASDYQECG